MSPFIFQNISDFQPKHMAKQHVMQFLCLHNDLGLVYRDMWSVNCEHLHSSTY